MRINFDANASVRALPEVLECLKSYENGYLNASSVHQLGQAAKKVIDQTKEEISALLGLDAEDKIIFTSGATEANNAALQVNTNYSGNKTACSAVEHSAVLEYLRSLPRELTLLAPDRIENEDYLQENLDSELSQFAVMAANNETGQIFDVSKISAAVKKISPRSRIHCDAVQAVGKCRINFKELNVDTLSLSGHKLGALSGIGALVISKHCSLNPWILGGPQQSSLRAGTENILGIKTLGIAVKAARLRLENSIGLMSEAKKRFEVFFSQLGERCVLNKFGSGQLLNTISVRFDSIAADDLVVALDLSGISVSAGSACDSGRPNPSHVLLAHGLTKKQAKETIRISFEPQISEQDIEAGLKTFASVLERAFDLKEAA